MKKILFFISLLLLVFRLSGQENLDKGLDSLYREDQFYIGITYNLLANKPKNVSQRGFSSGFHFGFIRDMPINKNRNFAMGLGLGYSTNSFNQNLLIGEDETGLIVFSVLNDNNTYTKNKFTNHLIELPFEFRWRTSTPDSYNFWRIYAGFKLGYMFANTIKYKGDLGGLNLTGIDAFNRLQYGLTFSAGYNTWNFCLQYALKPIFSNDAKLNGNNIDMNILKVGLIFYIL